MALTNKDASIALGMVARGDKQHDIAAFFGENQARIKEVQDGSHGGVAAAPAAELPPKGAPGPKGWRLRASVEATLKLLEEKGEAGAKDAIERLKAALERYNRHET